jgi:hypothetical protein
MKKNRDPDPLPRTQDWTSLQAAQCMYFRLCRLQQYFIDQSMADGLLVSHVYNSSLSPQYFIIYINNSYIHVGHSDTLFNNVMQWYQYDALGAVEIIKITEEWSTCNTQSWHHWERRSNPSMHAI